MNELTVVVPTFNGATHLKATLDSLHRQSTDLSVLVVDDGSTDATVELARAHIVGATVIEQENSGVAVARNRGLAWSTSPYVAFLDQDDLWHPDRARILLDLARESGRAAVATTEQAFALETDREALNRVADGRESWPAHWIAPKTEPQLLDHALTGSEALEELDLDRLLSAPIAVTTSLLYHRESAIAAGGCATFIKAADDHVLNVNITRIFGPILRINRPALFYRVHPSSTTTVSPLVAPYLTTLLALRHGRTVPSDAPTSDYVDHLLRQLPRQELLSRLEQLALLTLSVPPARRKTWVMRWAKAQAGRLRPGR
jgi:glycosyltransferase involved in cell wall biosynthesis